MSYATPPSADPKGEKNPKIPPQPTNTTRQIAKIDPPARKNVEEAAPDPKTVALPGYPATAVKRPWWKFWGKKEIASRPIDRRPSGDSIPEVVAKKPTPMKETGPNRSKVVPRSVSAIDPAKVAAKSTAHQKSLPEKQMAKAVIPPKVEPAQKVISSKPKPKPPEFVKRVIPPIAKPQGAVMYSASLDILPPIPLETMVAESQTAVIGAIENGQGDVLKAISGGNEKLGTVLNKVNTDLGKVGADLTKIGADLEKSATAAASKGEELKTSLKQVGGSIGDLQKVNEKSLTSMSQMSKLMTTVETGVKGIQGEVAKSTKAYDELVKKSEESAQKQAEEISTLQKKTLRVNILLGLGLIGAVIAYLVS